MILRPLHYEPTPEDRLTRTKWARAVGIVYGTIFLLLLATVTAQHIHVEHNAATAGHHASVRSGN